MLLSAALPAQADTTEARCELRKDADKQSGRSGPCTFSQRQGRVHIDLRDGSRFDLEPGAKPDHFHDQNGHKVTRKASGDVHEYKWERGKRIIVRFGKPRGAGSAAGRDTPHELRDLVSGRRVGGEVDDELARRGYRHVKSTSSHGELWSFWREHGGDGCVSVHFDADRRVRSIVPAPAPDCG